MGAKRRTVSGGKNDVRCVKKFWPAAFGGNMVQYSCVPWDHCGTLYDTRLRQNVYHECDFAKCMPDDVLLSSGVAEVPPNNFRCWDSCTPYSSTAQQCSHLDGRFLLDPYNGGQLVNQSLASMIKVVDDFATGCEAFKKLGFEQECRWMRCHYGASAHEDVCNNTRKVVAPGNASAGVAAKIEGALPPCRSSCEGMLRAQRALALTVNESRPASVTSCEAYRPGTWVRMHCDAVASGNCSLFPPDSEAGFSCEHPERFAPGAVCRRPVECVTTMCPRDEEMLTQNVAGYCCAAHTNGCSGNGVCDSQGECKCFVFSGGPRCDALKLPWFVLLAMVLVGVQAAVYPLLALGYLGHMRKIRPLILPPPPPPPPPKRPHYPSSSEDDDFLDDDDDGTNVYGWAGASMAGRGLHESWRAEDFGDEIRLASPLRPGTARPKTAPCENYDAFKLEATLWLGGARGLANTDTFAKSDTCARPRPPGHSCPASRRAADAPASSLLLPPPSFLQASPRSSVVPAAVLFAPRARHATPLAPAAATRSSL